MFYCTIDRNIIDCNRNLTFYYIFVIHLKSLQCTVLQMTFLKLFFVHWCLKKAITLQVLEHNSVQNDWNVGHWVNIRIHRYNLLRLTWLIKP